MWRPRFKERNVWPEASENDMSEINELNQNDMINILMWYLPWNLLNNWPSGRAVFENYKCPVHSCSLSTDTTTFLEADVIVFHLFDLPVILTHGKSTSTTVVPETRTPNQKYVLFIRGPQAAVSIPPKMSGMFNITMTHRTDSDIPHPYGTVVPLDTDEDQTPKINHAVGKTKLAVLVTSNCSPQSKRMTYARLLKQHMTFDIFGNCSGIRCPGRCLDTVNDTYKFYFAFENSFCHQYVTEKVYAMLHRGGIVPVVLGATDYSRHLPPHSYIDIRDFTSPKLLADYLSLLDKNDTLYNTYFTWRRHYAIRRANDVDWGPMFCRLCYHLQRTRRVQKILTNATKWWKDDQCISPVDYYRGHLGQNISLITWI